MQIVSSPTNWLRQSLFAAGAAGLIAASSVAPAAAASNAAVSITEAQPDRYAFGPATLNVTPGTVITWTNSSDAPHTVTSNSGAFGSGTLQQNQTFSFTLNTPGTYAYHCTIHPYMTGSIVVAAANSAAPAAAASTAASQSAAPSSASPARPAAASTPAVLPKTGASYPASPSRAAAAGLAIGSLALLAAAGWLFSRGRSHQTD